MKYLSILFLIFIQFILHASTVKERTIVFIGDSLSAGYGISKDDGYVELTNKEIQKAIVNSNQKIKFVNGSVSGSTTSSLKSRLRWFAKYKPELVVFALGANDGLRGIKVSNIRKNLEEGIQMAKEKNMNILLVGMMMPPNYGKEYTLAYQNVFDSLAKKYSVEYIPFLLEGVAGEKELNQEDGIHPNEKGHKIMSVKMTKKLLEILNVRNK